MDILIGPENLARIGELQNLHHDDASDGYAYESKIQTSLAINCCWLLNLLHRRFTAAGGDENIATDTFLV